MSPTLDEIVQGYTALNEEMQVLFQECRELRAKLEGRCQVCVAQFFYLSPTLYDDIP